jgi:hypothetical protein
LACEQTHLPKLHAPEQQRPARTQSAPGGSQAHAPIVQAPTQQSASLPQLMAAGRQQRPESLLTKQICIPGQPLRQSTLSGGPPHAATSSKLRKSARTSPS